MGGGKHSVTSGAAVPATCRPALVRRGPWMSRSPHALPAPEYRLAPRVGSMPTPRVVMPAGFPWRQGMLCRDGIASVKFSLPERLHLQALLTHQVKAGVTQAQTHALGWAHLDRRVRQSLLVSGRNRSLDTAPTAACLLERRQRLAHRA